MSAGNAQRYEIILNDQPLFKMHHYATGGSVDKAIWSDAAKTSPLAQPAVADANGMLTFFADGDYRMVFTDSADVSIPNMDYSDFLITSDFSTGYEGNQGTILPSASAANKGFPFLLLDGSDNILGFYVSDGTQYKAMVTFNAAGAQVIEAMITKNHPWYDITHPDFGAVEGGADATSAIQTALNAINAAGGGTLFSPPGLFTVDGGLTLATTNLIIYAQGSTWKKTAGASTDTITLTPGGDNVVEIDGLRIETSIAATGAAGIAITHAAASSSDSPNLILRDVYVGPTVTDKASAYFQRNIRIVSSTRPKLDGVTVRSYDNDITTSTGIILLKTTDASLDNINISNMLTGLSLENITLNTTIDNLHIDECVKGVVLFPIIGPDAAADSVLIDSAQILNTHTFGIATDGGIASGLQVSNSKITKSPNSTSTWQGVGGEHNNPIIKGNRFSAFGATGDATAVEVSGSGTDGVITGNICDSSLTHGITLGASTEGFVVKDNIDKGVATQFLTNTGTANIVKENYPSPQVSVASTTNMVISGVSDDMFVTGTTNITGLFPLALSYEGRIITLTFEGVLTLADGTGNLKLRGDFVTEADATIMLQYDAGISWWTELSRSIGAADPGVADGSLASATTVLNALVTNLQTTGTVK